MNKLEKISNSYEQLQSEFEKLCNACVESSTRFDDFKIELCAKPLHPSYQKFNKTKNSRR